MSTRTSILILAALGLSACSAGSDRAEEQAEAADATAKQDHVWKEQVETIDRAKDVEKTLKESDEARRKAMEDAGGG